VAVRTTYAEVALIIEVDSTISSDLAPFIEVANNLVTQVCTDSDYSDATLELIERWLSAHFYAIRDLRRDSEKAGAVSRKFQYKVGLNLQVTVYGQQAMIVDTAGNLLAVSEGKRRTPRINWLGTGDSYGNDDTE